MIVLILLLFSFILVKPVEAAPAQALVFSGVSPNPVEPGQIVTITGQGFGQTGYYNELGQSTEGNYIYLGSGREILDGQYFPLISWSDNSISFLVSEEILGGQPVTGFLHSENASSDITFNLYIKDKPVIPLSGLLNINFSTTCGDDHRPFPNVLLDIRSLDRSIPLTSVYSNENGTGSVSFTITKYTVEDLGINGLDVSTSFGPMSLDQKSPAQKIVFDNNPYKDENITLPPFHSKSCDDPYDTTRFSRTSPSPTPISTDLSPIPPTPIPSPSPLTCGSKYDPSNQQIQYIGCGQQFLWFGQSTACFSVQYRDDITSCQWTQLYSPRGLGGLAAPSSYLCYPVNSCDQIPTATFDQFEALSRGENPFGNITPTPSPSPSPIPTPEAKPITVSKVMLANRLLWSEESGFQTVSLSNNRTEIYTLRVEFTDGYFKDYSIIFQKPAPTEEPKPETSEPPQPIYEPEPDPISQPECPYGCQRYGDVCWRGPVPWEADDTCPIGYQDEDDPNTGCWGICR